MDAVARLRGARAMGFIVEGYDRYKGETECGDYYLVAEEPEGTVGTAVREFPLDVAAVDGGTWSSFPLADIA